jgi:hypothetical protein
VRPVGHKCNIRPLVCYLSSVTSALHDMSGLRQSIAPLHFAAMLYDSEDMLISSHCLQGPFTEDVPAKYCIAACIYPQITPNCSQVCVVGDGSSGEADHSEP